jgi:hypothetical protein
MVVVGLTGAARCIHARPPTAPAASNTTAPATHASAGRACAARPSAPRRSSIDANRRPGSGCSAVASTRSIARGTPSPPGASDALRVAAAISLALRPANGRRPCSDSYSDTANEN